MPENDAERGKAKKEWLNEHGSIQAELLRLKSEALRKKRPDHPSQKGGERSGSGEPDDQALNSALPSKDIEGKDASDVRTIDKETLNTVNEIPTLERVEDIVKDVGGESGDEKGPRLPPGKIPTAPGLSQKIANVIQLENKLKRRKFEMEKSAKEKEGSKEARQGRDRDPGEGRKNKVEAPDASRESRQNEGSNLKEGKLKSFGPMLENPAGAGGNPEEAPKSTFKDVDAMKKEGPGPVGWAVGGVSGKDDVDKGVRSQESVPTTCRPEDIDLNNSREGHISKDRLTSDQGSQRNGAGMKNDLERTASGLDRDEGQFDLQPSGTGAGSTEGGMDQNGTGNEPRSITERTRGKDVPPKDVEASWEHAEVPYPVKKGKTGPGNDGGDGSGPLGRLIGLFRKKRR